MRCPFCQAPESKVTDSRLLSEGEQIRRRRECLVCAGRFTTYETVELSLPRLIKRDGTRVQFSLDKLKMGMLRALEKRPVSAEAIDRALNGIVSRLRGLGEKELSTQTLGEWVMLALKDLDEIAYVRFASVYRRFQDLSEFKQEIARLQANPKHALLSPSTEG